MTKRRGGEAVEAGDAMLTDGDIGRRVQLFLDGGQSFDGELIAVGDSTATLRDRARREKRVLLDAVVAVISGGGRGEP